MLQIANRKGQVIERARALYDSLAQSGALTFILGTTDSGAHVAQVFRELGWPLAGFINDYAPHGSFCGLPVGSADQVPPTANIISCCIGSPLTAARRLSSLGLNRVINYFELCLLGAGRFALPPFFEENFSDLEQHPGRYAWLMDRLADEASREVLKKVLDFRYNYDVNALEGFRNSTEEQYFEAFLNLDDDEIFVDGGGFDGLTTAAFIKKHPHYRQIHFFEPDPELLAAAKTLLADNARITYHPLALSDRRALLRFSKTNTAFGRLAQDGSVEVQAAPLDEVLGHTPPTMIKLDIEGAEWDALHGGESILRQGRPKLAICVYHRQSDFWRIPEYLLSLNPDYRLHLRHYTESIFDTVMYFS